MMHHRGTNVVVARIIYIVYRRPQLFIISQNCQTRNKNVFFFIFFSFILSR